MQKKWVLFFTFCYLILTSGVKISAHYCHGNLISFHVAFSSEGCCCNTNADSKDCCQQTEVFFSIEDEQLTNSYRTSFAPSEKKLIDKGIELTDFSKVYKITEPYSSDISPPVLENIYLLNSTFLFYG